MSRQRVILAGRMGSDGTWVKRRNEHFVVECMTALGDHRLLCVSTTLEYALEYYHRITRREHT